MSFADRRHGALPAILGTLAALSLIVAACSSAGTSVAETSTAASAAAVESSEAGGDAVSMVNFAYDPAELTVAAGTTVTFTNDDDTPHTVTEGENGSAADGARFDEEAQPGDSVEVTFDEAGDVNVTCTFHPDMNMVVHVE